MNLVGVARREGELMCIVRTADHVVEGDRVRSV